jgi:hypothetical protein
MGWTYLTGATRADVISEVVPREIRRSDGTFFRTLSHCCRDNVLYALHESTAPDGAVMRWIAVTLLQRTRDGWGYKAMDESMHPFVYDCPVHYVLAASEPVNVSAASWRAKVLSVAASRGLHAVKE